MSSSRGTKFQDHYVILDVDPKADQTTVLAAYSNLVAKYHPTRGTHPDTDKYQAISTANEILSDPSSRSAFDQLRGNPQQEGPHKFSGLNFFEQTAGEPMRRLAILCLLYDRARQTPTRPGLSFRQTEAILNMTGDEMRFAMAYLKHRGLAVADDKSNLLVTVDGMDYVEKADIDPAAILALVSGKVVPHEEGDAVLAPPQDDPAEVVEHAVSLKPLPSEPVHKAEPTQSENLAARIRTRMAIPRPPASA